MSDDAAIGFEFVAMAGSAEIRLAGLPDERAAALAELAIAEVRRIEQRYSRYRDDSIIARINTAAGSGRSITVDEETAGLLAFGERLWRLSEGRFDITSGVLRRAWQFQSGVLPEAAAVEEEGLEARADTKEQRRARKRRGIPGRQHHDLGRGQAQASVAQPSVHLCAQSGLIPQVHDGVHLNGSGIAALSHLLLNLVARWS